MGKPQPRHDFTRWVTPEMVEAAKAYVPIRDEMSNRDYSVPLVKGKGLDKRYWDAHARLYSAVNVRIPKFDDLWVAAQRLAERELKAEQAE